MITLEIGNVYLTQNNIKVTIISKTFNGYLGSLVTSSISNVSQIEYTPDGRAMHYVDRNDNDAQGDYDIVAYLPFG
jgi:hypothetical protein